MNVAEFAAANLSRATGAGLDPHHYLRVTAALSSLDDWPDGFVRAGEDYLARAEAATSALTAADHYRAAARWFHFACLLPHHDRDLATKAAARSDAAMGRSLDLAEPGARRLQGSDFVGWLRGPADAAATVVIVPGMDSSKEEFHALSTALLRRGVAVFAMDGPGQGVLAATSTIRPDYHQTIGRVIDALGVTCVGLAGMSLGGYYAAESAAHEPRVAATLTVSGPFRLTWDSLPPFVHDTLTQRAGGHAAARDFAGRVDLSALAPRIAVPLLAVDGGQDLIPGVTNSRELARLAPSGEHLLIDHGDHLLGNAQPDWLGPAADWMITQLTQSTTT
ncbi:alpha/beta hydrolase family protein [Nonomuraea sp. NPDC059194]|uniref:alpha/beta hydrolase family protein n=1 Tax=Nonomuraea sp. NPDC059194 TaxID=3346764 RepID=UPI00367AD7E3